MRVPVKARLGSGSAPSCRSLARRPAGESASLARAERRVKAVTSRTYAHGPRIVQQRGVGGACLARHVSVVVNLGSVFLLLMCFY